MGKKRIFSLLLCAALAAALLPTAALAAGTGSFVVEGDPAGYSYANHTLTFGADAAGKTYTVSMALGVETLTADKIDIRGGTSDKPVSLTLDNVNIRLSSEGCACALESNSYVGLTLRGDNILASSGDYSGIQVFEGATLSISEDSVTPAADSLTAIGNYIYGAAICGCSANIIINSGTVKAIGGYCHAGIWGGNVTINGGTVIASSGFGIVSTAVTINGGDVTAIGSGGGISGDSVAITGGTVTASSYLNPSIRSSTAVYISGGSVHGTGDPVISGTPQNNSSDQTPVYLTAVTLPGISGKTSVSSLKISVGGALYSYGAEGMETGADGRLYLYLPEGPCNLQIKAGAYSYAAALTVGGTGANTVTANDLNSTGVDIDTPGTYVLTGSTNVNQVVVNGGTETEPVNIVLDNINIVNGSDFGSDGDNIHPAIDLHSGSFVNLTLQGTNMLFAEGDTALHVPEGAAVTIGGGGLLTMIADGGGAAIGSHTSCVGTDIIPENSGSITINGGTVTAIISDSANSPGIGSDCKGRCGSITINGGTVTATAAPRAAAIGSGFEGSVGSITINGGTVTATASVLGAAIGGGAGSTGGTVTINGGTVTAAGDSGAGIGGGDEGSVESITITGGTVNASRYAGAGIGGGGNVYISGGNVRASSVGGEAIGKGQDGSDSGTLQNNSTDQTPVCLTTVTLQNAAGESVGDMPVSSLAVHRNGSAYPYITKDMQTDADGKLYLYLPAGAVVTAAQAAEGHYLGSVTAASDSAASQGTLTLSCVSGVTPEGTNAPVSGNLAITFLGEMDPSVPGTVSLNGELPGGAWSDGNTVYTVPYSGLSHNTSYTVSISGFKNAAGNTMVTDSTNGFTTCAAPDHSAGDNPVYYTIRSSAGTGGSISPSGNTAVKEGDDQTYTVAADDGYEIKNVLVDGASAGAVTGYAFSDVSKNHTIAVTFQKKAAEWQNPYSDVQTNAWYYDAVRFMSDKGLMQGDGGKFDPDGGMTRGMFATVLYRLSGDTGSYTSSFADVPFGEWYENAVAWAAENGVSGGVGDNRFAPDNGITRQQLAVLLYNYAKYKGYDVSVGEDTNILSYKDALDISDYAYPALQWACGAGIMDGDSGYLNPNGQATRAQVAAMLERFVENVAG